MFEDLKLPQAKKAINALNLLAGTRSVEVDLPILGTKAVVTPISGSEDLKLRTMKASGSSFIKTFNSLLFEHTTFDAVKFADVDDFQMHLTPPDKAVLVYALLDATFTKLPEKIITCPACGDTESYTFTPGQMIHGDSIIKKWELKEEFTDYTIRSEIIPGFAVYYSMPTEADRIIILDEKANSDMRENITDNGDVLSALELFCIYIKKIEIVTEEETLVLTDKLNDIIPTIKGMPIDLQTSLLDDVSVAPLVEYAPKFYLNVHCTNPECKSPEFKWTDISPEQDFFRKALSIYN